MSGYLHEVFRNLRYTPCQTCPEELKGAKIKFKPMDADSVEVDAEAACASAKALKLAQKSGAGCEVDCPVKNAVLKKVLDFMNQHKDQPMKELITPLPSNVLTECGCSKWDANFVKVDKDLLFDIMYAAIALDIGSLLLLVNAQISTMMNEQEPAKIRKMFGFSMDLPDSEETELLSQMTELHQRNRWPTEGEGSPENVLSQSAAVLGGLYSAADKHGGLSYALGRSSAPVKSAGGKSWRLSCWRAACLMNWRILQMAPAEVTGDKELLLSAVSMSGGAALKFASEALKADKMIVLEAVKFGGKSLGEAAISLRSDRAFVLEAVKLDGSALEGAADIFQTDKAFILQAMAMGCGAAMSGVKDSLKEDATFALQCAAQAPEALLHLGESLRFSKEFAMKVVKLNGSALAYLPMKFRADGDITSAAMYEDAGAKNFAHVSRVPDFDRVKGMLGDQTLAAMPGPMQMSLTAEVIASNSYSTVKSEKMIVFTAMSTITPNMGQANYIAANNVMDKIPGCLRPEIDGLGIMWGTVGGMGMRWKAFASMDMMNQQAHNLLSIDDCCKILHIISCRMDPPEWFGAQYMDMPVREGMLMPTTSGGGFRPSEAASLVPTVPGKQAGRTQERQVPTADNGVPLGGWPGLVEADPLRGLPALKTGVPLPLLEGCRVELTNMQAKNGLTGTLTKFYAEGKCKVALDQKGQALVKPENLIVLESPPPRQRK